MKSVYMPFFSNNPLDRMDKLRGTLQDFFTSPDADKAVIILESSDKLLIKDMDSHSYLFKPQDLYNMGISLDSVVFLGKKDEVYYFAKSVDPSYVNPSNSMDLRTFVIGYLFSDTEVGILAQAFSVLRWHESHSHCPSCGQKHMIMHDGWRQDCKGCGKQHFPRVDPVVIMLVTAGNDCLLGSGVAFQKQRYSCLAGYMEPGETIEQAARRELLEEAGIHGTDVRYVLSQPWPFPYTLMIGVHVQTEKTALVIDYQELSDAQWFSKEQIQEALAGNENLGFTLPPNIAIAHTLLEYWINACP